MNALKENRWIAIGLVIVATVVGQIPAFDAWLVEQTGAHPHVVVLVEGIITVILLLFATFKGKGVQP